MRKRLKTQLNKRYFHNKPRINKRDTLFLKEKILFINKKNKRDQKKQEYKKL
jgi:hypothetical protein